MRIAATFASFALVMSALPACSAQQAYGSGQAWQQNQCSKIPDKAEFDRCMSRSNTPYESYKREIDTIRK